MVVHLPLVLSAHIPHNCMRLGPHVHVIVAIGFRTIQDCAKFSESAALESQPPFAFQAAEAGIPPMDRSSDVGMTGMDQRPGALASKPGMAGREFLSKKRIEAPTNRCGAVPPGVGKQPAQHGVE